MGFVGGFRAVGSTRSVRRYPAFIEDVAALPAMSATFVRRDGTSTMTGATWNVGGATEINNVQRLIIGSTVDQQVAGVSWGLQVEEANGVNLLIRNSSVNDVTKEARIAVAHRLNAEEPLTLFYGFSSAGSGIMHIGGGSGLLNAATDIRLWTAANNSTLEGTEMVRVANAVGVRIESDITGDPADLFQVESAVGTAMLTFDATGDTTFGAGTDLGSKVMSIAPVGTQMTLANSVTNAAQKLGTLGALHYNSDTEEDVCIFYSNSSATANIVSYGGGTSSMNAAMTSRFYAAGNFNTTTGTEMKRITLTGVRYESGVTGNPSDLFQVESAVGTAILAEDATGHVGIGGAPSANLHVIGSNPIFRVESTADQDQRWEFVHNSASPWSIGIDNSDRGLKFTESQSFAAGPTYLHIKEGGYIDFLSTSQAIGIPKIAGDPASPVDGDIWYDTASDDLQVEADSLTEKVCFSRYAQIYVEGASAAQSITTGGTYEKFTGFTTNGSADGATADAANDKITLTKKGHYLVTFQVSYSGTNSSTWDFQGRWNGVVQAQLHCTRKLGTGGDVGSCSFVGIVDATSGSTDLEVWMTADSNGDSMTAQDAQLNATWLGTT